MLFSLLLSYQQHLPLHHLCAQRPHFPLCCVVHRCKHIYLCRLRPTRFANHIALVDVLPCCTTVQSRNAMSVSCLHVYLKQRFQANSTSYAPWSGFNKERVTHWPVALKIGEWAFLRKAVMNITPAHQAANRPTGKRHQCRMAFNCITEKHVIDNTV